jgi:hypothetical protein
MERPSFIYEKAQPNHIIFVKDSPPPGNVEAIEAFENIMKSQNGFVTVRYFGRNCYVEFKETNDAAETIHKYNGHKYHAEAPPLRLDFDRDAGKPKKRKIEGFDHSRYPDTRYAAYSPPRMSSAYPSAYGRDGRDSYRMEMASAVGYDPYPYGNGGGGGLRDSGRSFERAEVGPAPSQRVYSDPYAWMRTFLPYWETTGNVPLDPNGRMEANSHKLTKSCPTLFIKRLPNDITKRELQLMFCWLPNFLAVRTVNKIHEIIAFIDFVDAASAYVAMATMQGFFIGGISIQIEYDRWSGQASGAREQPR